MGEWERKSQAKAHEQRTDLAADPQPGAAGTGAELVIVRCLKNASDIAIPYGASLRIVERKRPLVEVFLAGRCVGEVCAEDSRLLRDDHTIANRPGSSFGGRSISTTHGPEFSVQVEL